MAESHWRAADREVFAAAWQRELRQIPEFTGISAPYEAPEEPEMTVDTSADAADTCVDRLVGYVEQKFGA